VPNQLGPKNRTSLCFMIYPDYVASNNMVINTEKFITMSLSRLFT
jgi:hypothetical protein